MQRANAEYRHWQPDELGRLTVACWCGAHYVNVPAADIRQGRTRRCGLPACARIADEKEKAA